MEIKKLSEYMRQWIQVTEPDKQVKTNKKVAQRVTSKLYGTATVGDKVELSVNSLDKQAQRAEKISKIKAQIEEGSYKPSPEKIAERMLEESW